MECRKRCRSLCRHGVPWIFNLCHCRAPDFLRPDWSRGWHLSGECGCYLVRIGFFSAFHHDHGGGGFDDDHDEFNDVDDQTNAIARYRSTARNHRALWIWAALGRSSAWSQAERLKNLSILELLIVAMSRQHLVVETGVDPVTSRFSGARSAN